MFHYPRFANERERLNDALDAVIGTHYFVEEMLKSVPNWNAIDATVNAIQEKLQELK